MDSEPGKARWTLARGTQRKCLGEVIQTPPTQGKPGSQRRGKSFVTALLTVGDRDLTENSLGYFFGI